MCDLHIYEVGMVSTKLKIEAPSALAAATRFGIDHCYGSSIMAVLVYTEDGREINNMPYGRWFGMTDARFTPEEDAALGELISEAKVQLDQCRYIEDDEVTT